MGLGGTKASTKDVSGGLDVATATNEDSGTNNLPVTVIVGNKSTYIEVSRTGIAAADAPTGGDLTTTGFAGASGTNLGDAGNAISATLRATCSVAGASLTGRLVFYDVNNFCLGMSEQFVFASDATRRLGNASGNFVCPRQTVDLGTARKFRFIVDIVSSGTWSVYVAPM